MPDIQTIDPITGQPIDIKLSMFADAVIKAKQEKGPWEVMDLIVNHWIKSNPTRYDSYITHVETTKDSRRNVYGSNKAKTLRLSVSIPEDIIKRFRTIYKATEFNFDKDFLAKFWERYPVFRIAERN